MTSPVLGAVNSKGKKKREKHTLLAELPQCHTLPGQHLPLPGAYFIPGLAFSGLVLGFFLFMGQFLSSVPQLPSVLCL